MTIILSIGTLCGLAGAILWWRTPTRQCTNCGGRGHFEGKECGTCKGTGKPLNEVRDAYIASLWTGTIAFAALLAIGGTGLGILWLGLRWLRDAVHP